MRRCAWLVALIAALASAAPALADPAPFGHPCQLQYGVRYCPTMPRTGNVRTWDGTPIDVDVSLPPTGNGPWPTIVLLHGFSGNKLSYEGSSDQGSPLGSPQGDATTWTYHADDIWYAEHGYAVVVYDARGNAFSCGYAPTRYDPACARGWLHITDQRYEARDTQYLLGLLVDQGIARPDALGVSGTSYGGIQALELAYLRDRIRKPDGSSAPWRSPKGTPLQIAAAWPRIGWSDAMASVLPNGRYRDDVRPVAGDGIDPIGMPLASFGAGLVGLLDAETYTAPPGQDPSADINTWLATFAIGEPWSAQAQAYAREIDTFHTATLSGPPAPLLIENGWTDDVVPATNAIRAYRQIRAAFPGAAVSLQLGDLGHNRGANKPEEDHYFNDHASAFFDRYLKHDAAASAPAPGSVTTFTQTCPASAPPGGPHTASDYTRLHAGVIGFAATGVQAVSSSGGDETGGVGADPNANQGGPCNTFNDANESGTAAYRFPIGKGFTLSGRPEVRAHVDVQGLYGQLDARLFDVAPGGTETLVTRTAYRLLDNEHDTIVFQLNGNAYRFPAGDAVKLELLGRDLPYVRFSNSTFTLNVSDVSLTLPTLEPQATSGASRPPITGAVRPTCISRRTIRLHLPRAVANTYQAIDVYINGRRSTRVRRQRGSVLIRLSGRPRGTYTVKIVATRRHGAAITVVRHYRSCAGRR